jgi:ABC-type multidrug transport system ATPase subunit
MSAPVVQASDVSFAYGDHAILDGVSFSAGQGELIGLVGPNGSGKTTFLKLLTGLRRPDAGEITVPDADRSVAYLPQSPAFRPGFTAREIIDFYTDLANVETAPEAFLRRVGLSGAADRNVEALSGGMRRLLGLAQALIGDPPIVMLDEPTSGLDPDMSDRIFDVMVELAAADQVLLVASHDLSGIEMHASRVLFFSEGRIQLDGSPGWVREQTNTESLREAFSATLRSRREAGTSVDEAIRTVAKEDADG